MKMKPVNAMNSSVAVDEMFPEGYAEEEQTGSGSNLLMDVTNDKDVHADFYNDFGDLFDDEEEDERRSS